MFPSSNADERIRKVRNGNFALIANFSVEAELKVDSRANPLEAAVASEKRELNGLALENVLQFGDVEAEADGGTILHRQNDSIAVTIEAHALLGVAQQEFWHLVSRSRNTSSM